MATMLLTGFPGFIGRRLAAKLLETDSKASLVALVEPRMADAAASAAAELDSERIEVLPGDIGEGRLGLSDADYDRLAAEVTKVFHLAAIYDLAVPLEIAQRVNVDGTGNVLDFCATAKSLERLLYVSTAYVAGTRTGVVYEHELVMGQDFKNHYESTKFQAEVWVREAMARVPTTILRPAIVVGDSRTGETQKFDGPYFILRTIAEAERAGRAVVQFGQAGAPFNAVPVDFVVDSIAAAAGSPEAEGQTLHLVDPEPLSAKELTETLSMEYAGRPPKGRIPPGLAAASLRVPAIRNRLGGTPPESLMYLNHPVRFDTRRTVELLEPLGVRPPNFREYAGAMVRFFQEHQDDPAFVPGYKPPAGG
ncbi:MAG: SDR family oxidoreductase [Solirubrobacterales bacterium]